MLLSEVFALKYMIYFCHLFSCVQSQNFFYKIIRLKIYCSLHIHCYLYKVEKFKYSIYIIVIIIVVVVLKGRCKKWAQDIFNIQGKNKTEG